MSLRTNIQQEEDFTRYLQDYSAHLAAVLKQKKEGKNIDSEIEKVSQSWARAGIIDKNGQVIPIYAESIAYMKGLSE